MPDACNKQGFKISQFNGVIEIYLRLTFVATMNKIGNLSEKLAMTR